MRHTALWQTLAGCALILAAATSQATVYKIETTDDVEVIFDSRPENASPEDDRYQVTSTTSGAQCRLREAIYAISYQTTVGPVKRARAMTLSACLKGKPICSRKVSFPLAARRSSLFRRQLWLRTQTVSRWTRQTVIR